jgi:hypothetical protein
MDCGLCLDADKRFAKREVIVFEEHGPAQAKERNRQLRAAEELVQISKKGAARIEAVNLIPTDRASSATKPPGSSTHYRGPKSTKNGAQ